MSTNKFDEIDRIIEELKNELKKQIKNELENEIKNELENEKLKKERLEKLILENEKIEKERSEKIKLERQRLEKEKLEKQRLKRENNMKIYRENDIKEAIKNIGGRKYREVSEDKWDSILSNSIEFLLSPASQKKPELVTGYSWFPITWKKINDIYSDREGTKEAFKGDFKLYYESVSKDNRKEYIIELKFSGFNELTDIDSKTPYFVDDIDMCSKDDYEDSSDDCNCMYNKNTWCLSQSCDGDIENHAYYHKKKTESLPVDNILNIYTID